MKKKILMVIAFGIVVAALVGCQQKSESNPPAADGAPGASTPGSAAWNNTNGVLVPTNPATTNTPGATNQ